MASAELTLIGKPGCHLCDEARVVISDVVTELAAHPGAPVISVEERSILDDAELYEKYVEEIPVLLINEKVHTYWRVDAARLRAALLEAG